MDFKTSKVLFVMVGCLVILIISRTSYAFNLTHILDEYISVCGSQICNIKKQGTNYLNHLQTTYNTHCPKCSCQVGCIQSGNCCPDLFFSLKPTCEKTSIVESPDWYFDPLFKYGTYSFDRNNHMDTKLNAVNCPPVLMISSCPQDATVIEKSLCNVSDLKEQQIQNKPVSSSKTGLIYRNIHCLKCHNESVENLILWNLKLECDYHRFEDFNYLVSYNEIIQKAIDENCSIAFEPNDKVSKRICVPDSNTIDLDRISSCNISGTWQIYDHDIDVACQSYDHTYFSFKNVFCYLCNPPSDTGHLISTCNATGMWEQYDANLQIACEKEKSSSITGKFKNIFCYLCNKNFSDEGNLPTFYGADVNVEDNGNLAWNEPFGYNFKVKSVNIQNIFDKDDLKRSTVTSDKRLISLSNSDLESEHYLSSFKMANLMKKYFALTGKTNFCTNYSLFNSLQDCNCDDYCAVQFYNEWGNGSCCVDSFIRKKSICTDQKYHEYNHFLVYEGCERFENSTIKNLCQKTKQKTVHDDLISFLPAQMLINNTPIDFKNIYCAFCNENLEVIQNYENEMVLWDFKLRCKVFIPIFYHFSLQDIIAFALNNGCRFLYKPPSSATVCSYNSFTMCNMTGNWNSFDPDIASSCNNYKVPYGTENKFCSMCNPSVRENIVYTSCNNTGEWGEYNSNIEENCLNMPAVEYHSPYKNIFCKECNRKNVEIYDLPNNNSTLCLGDCEVDINEMGPFIPRFRSIFKFTDYKIATTESDIEGNCLQNQIYNPFEKICIDLKCYPGRILTGEGCKPLLEMTKDIGYMLTFVLNGNLNTEIGDVIPFLDDVNNSLLIAMFNKDWYRWTLKKSILICQNRIFWNSTNISLLVNMNISYPNYVNRTSVEDSFLSSSKFSLPVHYFNTTFNLSVFPNEDMYLLSTLESQSKFTNTCITTDDNHKHLKRYSHVKRLLLCKQIELPENDIDIDNKTFRLTIKSLGVELAVMDYEMLPTSKVRICADQFESIISLKHTELDKPITYQNFIGFILMACTCISLVCLLFTFLTFLAYKSLRTLPGKNNMCLVFAMFCAQLLYQFGLNQTDSIMICQIIGVCMHYFWLATFGCISVCSFHMYRVFKTAILHSETFKKRTFLFYVIYSYCIPFIIVSSNAGVTFILKNNIGYGGHICFLNQPIGLIVTFISPIIIICLSNIFFFVVTTRTIHRTTVVAKEQHIHNNRSQFIIYVKLFTVTGIGWLLQVVDSYLPDTSNEAKMIFSTIISLTNTLQGLFIFISYVCNRRVLLLYKKGNILSTLCKLTRRTRSYELKGSSLHTISSS